MATLSICLGFMISVPHAVAENTESAGRHVSRNYFSNEFTDSQNAYPVETNLSASGSLYEKPSIYAPAIMKLDKGSTVTIIYRQTDWYAIKTTDNRLGWIHRDVLTAADTGKSVPQDLNDIEKNIKTVVVDIGRVRQEPSLSSDVIFGLRKGNQVAVIDTRGSWYLVKLQDDRTGWVHHSLFGELESSGEENPEDVEDVDFPTGDSAPPDSATDDQESKKVEAIKIDISTADQEKVMIKLNGFYPPKTFVLEEDVPKVVCDFLDAEIGKELKPAIQVNGRLIQRVRMGIHKGSSPKIRVVLDLIPQKQYDIEQLFYKKDNIYTLIVKQGDTAEKP